MKEFRPGVAGTIYACLALRAGHVVGYRARCRRFAHRIQHCLKLVFPCQTFAQEIVGNAFE